MDLMGAMIAAVALPLPAPSLRLRDHRDYCVGRATARHLLEGDAKAGSAELRAIGAKYPMLRRYISDYGKLRDAPSGCSTRGAPNSEVNQCGTRSRRGSASLKRRLTQFDEAGDVIKGYGREANALAHETSGKILETMKPRDELGAKIGALM